MGIEKTTYSLKLNETEMIDLFGKRIKEGYTKVAIGCSKDILNTDDINYSTLIIFYNKKKIAMNESKREGYGLGVFFPLIEGEFGKEKFKEYVKQANLEISEKEGIYTKFESLFNGGANEI